MPQHYIKPIISKKETFQIIPFAVSMWQLSLMSPLSSTYMYIVHTVHTQSNQTRQSLSVKNPASWQDAPVLRSNGVTVTVKPYMVKNTANRLTEFHQIYNSNAVQNKDLLSTFWSQNVKGRGHSELFRRRHTDRHIPVDDCLVWFDWVCTVCTIHILYTSVQDR